MGSANCDGCRSVAASAPPTCNAANFTPGLYCTEPFGHEGKHRGSIPGPHQRFEWANDPEVDTLLDPGSQATDVEQTGRSAE